MLYFSGVWCVLFLLLGYLIFGVLALAAVIVACYCALLYNSETEHRIYYQNNQLAEDSWCSN